MPDASLSYTTARCGIHETYVGQACCVRRAELELDRYCYRLNIRTSWNKVYKAISRAIDGLSRISSFS